LQWWYRFERLRGLTFRAALAPFRRTCGAPVLFHRWVPLAADLEAVSIRRRRELQTPL
jgi:hypothetical protein